MQVWNDAQEHSSKQRTKTKKMQVLNVQWCRPWTLLLKTNEKNLKWCPWTLCLKTNAKKKKKITKKSVVWNNSPEHYSSKQKQIKQDKKAK